MHNDNPHAQHPDHLLNPEVTFEPKDVRVSSVALLGVALLAVLFASELVVWGTFSAMRSDENNSQVILSPLRVGMGPELPPEPRLQGEPGHPVLGPQELRNVYSQADLQLDSSGWVNQSTGVAHIPIQQAMDMIVKNGLPSVPPAVSPATAKPAQTGIQNGAPVPGTAPRAKPTRSGTRPSAHPNLKASGAAL
jgi:hypothetical protein